MKKKDILGLIGADLMRNKTKRNKKKLDDFLIGEEDRHRKILNEKEKKEKEKQNKNPLKELVGQTHGEGAEYKPQVELLDFGKLNRMQPREQIRTLKREYLELIDKITDLSENLSRVSNENGELQIEARKNKNQLKIVKEFIRDLVGYFPDAHELKELMDTTEWKIDDVEMDIITKFKSLVNKVRFTEKEIEKEIREAKEKQKLLENELFKTKQELKKWKESSQDDALQSAEIDDVVIDTEPKDNSVENSGKSSVQPKEPEEIDLSATEEDLPKYVFMNVDRYLEALPDNGKVVLEIVGKTGIARNAELKKYVEEMEDEESKKYFYKNGKFDYNQLNSAVKLLRDKQFFDSKEVNLGARGHKFPVYQLSEVGKSVFYKLTKQKPVESELEQIKRDHASLEHGYLIKDCAAEFRARGYTVYEDRESCTFKLKDGKRRKVFDLIVEKDGKKMHIEVERGTHNEDDFLLAMDKIYEITSEMYFIAPNKNILYENTKGKVFLWITDRLGGFDKAKGKITVNFATFENLKKQQNEIWEEFKL